MSPAPQPRRPLPAEKRVPRRYRQVADHLAERIRAGEFPPGSRIPAERELAASLKVSRPTLREALIALEMMGYVEVRGGSGIYVVAADRDDSEFDPGPGTFEILEARRMLETTVAAVAATSITPAQTQVLRACIEEMIASYEAGGFSEEADCRFHLTIAEATENSALLAVVRQLWRFRMESDMWRIVEDRSDTDKIRRSAIADHIAILKALEAGEPEAARAAMDKHIQTVIRHMLDAGLKRPSASAKDRRSKLRLLVDAAP